MGKTKSKRDEWLDDEDYKSKKNNSKEKRKNRKEARYRKENWEQITETDQ